MICSVRYVKTLFWVSKETLGVGPVLQLLKTMRTFKVGLYFALLNTQRTLEIRVGRLCLKHNVMCLCDRLTMNEAVMVNVIYLTQYRIAWEGNLNERLSILLSL